MFGFSVVRLNGHLIIICPYSIITYFWKITLSPPQLIRKEVSRHSLMTYHTKTDNGIVSLTCTSYLLSYLYLHKNLIVVTSSIDRMRSSLEIYSKLLNKKKGIL